jgi:hypothetical protein
LSQPKVFRDLRRRGCPVPPKEDQQSPFPRIELSQLSGTIRRAPLRGLCRLRADGAESIRHPLAEEG